MKALIFIMLFLCFISLLQINDTIIDVSLTLEDKAQMVAQEKMILKAEEDIKRLENEKEGRFLSKDFSDLSNERRLEWIILKIARWEFFYYLIIVFLPIFIFNYMKKKDVDFKIEML